MEQNESPCFIYFDTLGGQNNLPTFTKIYIVALVPHAQSLTGQSIPAAFAFPLYLFNSYIL